MTLNTKLLCRFSEHDANAEEGVCWHVSGGTIEGTKRHYRAMYTNGEEKREYEVCFDVAGSSDVIKHDVAEFKSHVKSWITIYTSEQFMRALYDLFEKDPWMNMTS